MNGGVLVGVGPIKGNERASLKNACLLPFGELGIPARLSGRPMAEAMANRCVLDAELIFRSLS